MTNSKLYRALCLFMSFALIFATLVFVPVTKADAITTGTFRSVDSFTLRDKTVSEKVGNYYVKVINTGSSYQLRYSSTEFGTGRALKSVPSSTYKMGSRVVTNGDVVYFAVIVNKNLINTGNPWVLKQTGYIFKASISTGAVRKICSITNLTSVEGYYNGRIYFTKRMQNYSDSNNKLCRYNPSTNKSAELVKYYEGLGSYGKNFLGKDYQNGLVNVNLYLYNASTGKKTTPAKACMWAAITADRIIYIKLDTVNYTIVNYKVCRCTLSGKTTSVLKTVSSGSTYGSPVHVSRRGAYFNDYRYGFKLFRVSDKKWVTV